MPKEKLENPALQVAPDTHAPTPVVSRAIRTVALAALTACTYESPITNIIYQVPEAEATSSGFLDPSACGIASTKPSAEMPAIPLYGEQADGLKVAILVKEDQLKLANETAMPNANAGGYVEYIPGRDPENAATGEATATLCVTAADDSWTVCEEVALAIVGGMTRTEWHGDGEGLLPEGIVPTIPTVNIDTNQFVDWKILDSITDEKYDNLRLNSGQTLGLASAAISYELSGKQGIMKVPTSYIKVTSNVWGIDKDTGKCVEVPMLNMMRSKDGKVCEFNKDLHGGKCDSGFEGYSLEYPQGYQCEWSKGAYCDFTLLNDFSTAVTYAPMGEGFSEQVSSYTYPEVMMKMTANEFVMGFWDGYGGGNNNVWDLVQDEFGQLKFWPIPYSRDLSMIGGDAWVDFTGGTPITMGWRMDPSTCGRFVEITREMNANMSANCRAEVQDHEERLKAIAAYRPQDDVVFADKQNFCDIHPPALDRALDDLQVQCDALLVPKDETGLPTETGQTSP